MISHRRGRPKLALRLALCASLTWPLPHVTIVPQAFEFSRALSIAAFLGYGVACLTTTHMVAEFKRFGLPKYRRLVGALEVAGASGLLVSYWHPPILAPAAGGLTLLMALGVWTRLRVRDSAIETAPAFAFCLVNGFILWYALT